MRRDGVTKVEALRASLPGRSSLAIDGFLESRPAGLQFDGNLLMQSASFAELAEWLHNGQKASLSPELKARLAASFALTANIRIRPQSILLADARARLGDTGAEGGIGFDWSARPVLTASIDAGTLALEKFGANLLAPSGLARLLGLPDSGLSQSPTEPADNFAWARDMDVTLGLRAHRITDGNRSFSDVDIDITRSGGDLLINKLDLTWTPGLELALAGQLTGLQHVPSGRITGTVAAATPVAGANLARLLSLAAGRDVPASLVDERTPLRVAVDLELGRAPSAGAQSVTSSRFRADGTLGRDRIRIEAETAGGLGGWLEQPAEITARMTGIDALATARWLLGPPVGAPAAPPAAAASVPLSASASRDVAATVVMTAVGIPAKSMKSYLRMAAGDLIDADLTSNLRLSGVGNNGPLIASWSGALNLRRMTAATLASLTWPALRAHVPDLPVTGRIAIDRTGAGITLKPQRITMGPSVIGGDLRLTRATAGAAAELEGQLTVTETSLSALASLILAPTADQDAAPGEASKSPGDATRAPSEAPEIAAKSSSAIWPSTQFSLDHLAGVTSNISIRIGALDWGPPGAALEGVALRIATTPSTVRISDFSARLGPASLTATAKVERGKAGAKITLDLTGRDIALERFAPERAREKRLAGTAAIELKLEGEALSPRSLSTLIQGSGVIRLKNAIVPGMTTEDATAAARAVIDGRVAIDALSSEMVVLAAKGQVTLGSPTLKLRIANGRADFPAIVFQQDEGALRNTTFVDIRRWQIDSQWIVTPARQPRPDTPGETVALPPVTIDYEGSLAATGAIVPKINLGDLERELVVRQMEANVARLERLRREDEARAAADEQRRRRIEDEQRRSIEEENRRRLGEPTATGEPLRPPEPARAIPPPSEARRSREGTQAPVNR